MQLSDLVTNVCAHGVSRRIACGSCEALRRVGVEGRANAAAAGNTMKLDGGKTPIFRGLIMYFPRALRAVADISAYGYEKYKEWGGWVRVEDAQARYTDALARHFINEQIEGPLDPESKLRHAAHAAWNALARLELALQEQERIDKSWADATVEGE